MTHVPEIIAHRGAATGKAEHTLSAYRHAIAEGADGWEADLRLTRDGHLVCVHDRRIDRTSDGVGAVSSYTLAELKSREFGDGGVLTLAELLALHRDTQCTQRLLLETKHPTKHGALVERTLAQTLTHFGFTTEESRIEILSVWPGALARMRSLCPQLPTVRLFLGLPPSLRSARTRAPIVAPRITALQDHPEYVQRAHASGKRVYTWTVNTAIDALLAARLGVDAIITDHPHAVREQIMGEISSV